MAKSIIISDFKRKSEITDLMSKAENIASNTKIQPNVSLKERID